VRRRFPVEPLRTLDAVHLATAELLGESPPLITIVTRDGRVRTNAEALGYRVESRCFQYEPDGRVNDDE